MNTPRSLPLALLLLLALAACGAEGGDPPGDEPAPQEDPAAADEPQADDPPADDPPADDPPADDPPADDPPADDPPVGEPSVPDEPPAGDPPVATLGCGGGIPSAGEWTLEHDGEDRSFQVRLPPGYDNTEPLPVVFSFHGRALNAAAQEATSGFTELGAQEDFIVAYPEGAGSFQSWSAGVCCSNGVPQDDAGFFAAMLERMSDELCVDESRIYANGLSAGAFMTYGLACEHADKLAAVSGVAGVTGELGCDPEAPVPVLHFHGDEDDVVPYEGNYGLTFLAADNHAAAWAERNGCSEGSSVFLDEEDVVCEEWTGCDASATVRLCTIEGGGHQWPGGVTAPGFGNNTDAIDATEMMWEFFSAHSR